MHDQVDPFDAVVDVHEAARLMSIPPNLDCATLCLDGLNNLVADRGREADTISQTAFYPRRGFAENPDRESNASSNRQ